MIVIKQGKNLQADLKTVKWDAEGGFSDDLLRPYVLDVIYIEAEGVELSVILDNIREASLPHLGRVLTFDGHAVADVKSQRWFENDARFIYSNIILPLEDLRALGKLKKK